MQVYEISSNQTPEYNRDDFVESYWLYPQELLERLQNGDRSKHDLPRLVQRLYLPQRT
jgi:isopentenyl-diphosphate delta-isomerase